MSGDPTDICGTPEHISGAILKDIFEGVFGVDHVASGGMDYAFGLTCRARSVEDKEHVLAIHLSGWVDIRLSRQGFVPPIIPSCKHLGFLAGTLVDDDRFYWRFF